MIIVSSSAKIPFGFEPTYEELKLFSSIVIFIFSSCFEPTYEELKPKGEGGRKKWW